MAEGEGFARPSRFMVDFILPRGIDEGVDDDGNNFTFQEEIKRTTQGELKSELELQRGLRAFCFAAELPGRNIDTAPDTNIYGPEREIAQGWSFADIDATFQLSSDQKEKNFFDTWQRLSFNPDTWSMGYYDDYTGTIQIFQLDEQNERRYGVELIECFPKTIAAQTYDYSAVNQQQKVNVSFSYRYWKNLTDESRLPRSLSDRINTIVLNSVERQIRSRIPSVVNRLTPLR